MPYTAAAGYLCVKQQTRNEYFKSHRKLTRIYGDCLYSQLQCKKLGKSKSIWVPQTTKRFMRHLNENNNQSVMS